MSAGRSEFMVLVRAICAGDAATASRLLEASPGLATERAEDDAFLEEILHYVYRGDSALHVAAAAYQREIARTLITMGAHVRATNRRSAEPLHYAADGVPGSRSWNPQSQAATIAALIEAGADPNAADKSGVMPLHRAVRTRCAAAVQALIDGGSDPRAKNENGSTPMDLATRNTGRGGVGSPEAKAEQQEILRLLAQHGQ
jgi:ankyrin repeat protein